MPFFMINIDTEAWNPHCFEVEAETSGKALDRVLTEIDAYQTERVLHSVHVGPACSAPTSDEAMAKWPPEDHLKRLRQI